MKRVISILMIPAMLLVSTMLLVSVSCSSPEDLEDNPVLKVAVVTALTGPVADLGAQGKYAAELAVERINANGGIKGAQVEAVIFDDKADVVEAALVAQRISEDEDYLCIVGHLFSSAALAALPIYEQAGLPYFATTANSRSLVSNNMIRMCLPTDVQGPQFADFTADDLGGKKIALIYAMGDYGVMMIEQIGTRIDEIGTADIVLRESFAAGSDRDFSAHLTKVLSVDADTVICIGDYTDVGLIIAQASRMGGFESVNFIGDASCLDSTFITRVVESGFEDNIYLLCDFNPYDNRQVFTDFFKDFHERYNVGDPTLPAAFYYDQLMIISQAMNTGATKETLVSKIKEMTFTDMLSSGGEMTFDERGDRDGYTMYVVAVRDGKFTTLN